MYDDLVWNNLFKWLEQLHHVYDMIDHKFQCRTFNSTVSIIIPSEAMFRNS